ncbi:MAG: DUF2225 domain-containing protein [Bacillota bacterium]
MSIEQLTELGKIKKFKSGDLICIKGETAGQMFILLSGQAGIYWDEHANKEQLSLLTAGDFFGELGILDEQALDFTAKAESPVIALIIPLENSDRLLKLRPDLAAKILASMGRRIRTLESYRSKVGQKEPSIETAILKAVFPQGTRVEKYEEAEKEALIKSEEILVEGGEILPSGHGSYQLIARETDKNFYYEKKVDCPICGNSFTAIIPRMTKLRLVKRENDLREVFKDFDPLWYAVRICPHCFFAKYHADFDKTHNLSNKGLKPYRDQALQLVDKISLPADQTLSINKVFLGYYLALYFEKIDNAPLTMAKLYISLSWLYKDVQDEKMYEYAWNKAFNYYHQVYYKTNLAGLTPSHEQQLCIVLGELFYRKGEKMEALKHFYAAIRRNDGISYYNNLARDRYMEIKDEN